MLPQSNCRVLRILDGGESEDYDYDGGGGAPLWSGDADGYLSSVAKIVTDGGALDRLSIDTLVVDEEVVNASAGNRVEFDASGRIQIREIVEAAARPEVAGIPSAIKLYLRNT